MATKEETRGVPLPAADRARLSRDLQTHGETRLVSLVGISRMALARALGAMPLYPASAPQYARIWRPIVTTLEALRSELRGRLARALREDVRIVIDEYAEILGLAEQIAELEASSPDPGAA